jgi:hypothetical protein
MVFSSSPALDLRRCTLVAVRSIAQCCPCGGCRAKGATHCEKGCKERLGKKGTLFSYENSRLDSYDASGSRRAQRRGQK